MYAVDYGDGGVDEADGAAWAAADDSDRTSTDTDDDDEDGGGDRTDSTYDAEVAALCWSAGSVGVARYLCCECRIEVFETPVCVVAGEAVRRRSSRAAGGARAGEGEMRIVVSEDVPASLLWLVRYLEVHRPQVLLPHSGSDALSDLVGLVAARRPLEVIRLSAATAFNAAEALPRLAHMYPAREAELRSRFHSTHTAMMRAMAALLQFVAAGQANVADVVERGVLHALYLADAAAEALQITRTERHPSSAQGRGRAKEGLSLRSLLSATASSPGKAMLRQWCALPCCDRAEIAARQSVVAFFVQATNHGVATQLRAALHHIRATSHVFTMMRTGRALRKHYVSLHRTLRGAIQVHRILSTVAHAVERLFVLLQSIHVEPLVEMADAVARTVAGVAVRRTAIQNRTADGSAAAAGATAANDGALAATVHINDGVDAVLDELRLRLHELRLSLQAKAEAAFAVLPWELRERLSLRCVYALPHGYLLVTPAVELVAVVEPYLVPDGGGGAARSPGSCADSTEFTPPEDGEGEVCVGDAEPATERAPQRDTTTTTAATAAAASLQERVCLFMADAFQWKFHHETEEGELCFKSAAMAELDVWVGDLQQRVQHREHQVRRELDTALLYGSLHLLRPTRALGELDCLLSFARVSAQEGWTRPEMVEAGRPTPSADAQPSHTTPAMEGADKGEWENDVDSRYVAEEEDEEEEDGVLEIENGWHPLLSRHLGLQQLVPFTLRVHTATDRVCLVLGVNGSGKSVLISAVAHIVFLAHIGCHVPAAAARLSLVNGIFAPTSSGPCELRARAAGVASARLSYASPSRGDSSAALQACEAEAAQSTFYSECVALHRVLHHVAGQQRSTGAEEGRALVILDEFGRGTAPEDGCALLKGTLRYFATNGSDGDDDDDDSAADMNAGGDEHEEGSGRAPPFFPHADDPRCQQQQQQRRQRSRWRRPPIVLCATHLVEMLEAPRSRGSVRTRTAAGAAFTAAAARPTPAPDPPLPLEWVKIYDMETLPTYAAADDVVGSRRAPVAPGAAGEHPLADPQTGKDRGLARGSAPLPVDVTPTFHPVCVTTHVGQRRWDDWRQHTGAHLTAGPALGRQCGLDASLLQCWESALRVLHEGP